MDSLRLWVSVLCTGLLTGAVAQSAEVKYSGKALRDPFMDTTEIKPVDDTAAVQQSIDSMSVQGVLYDIDNPVAIISGKIYHVGSPLGVGKVARIEKEGVTISQNGKQFTIKQSRGKTNDATSKKS